MKKFSEQLYTKAQSVKMDGAERQELRKRVVSYMEYHPLPTTAKSILSPLPADSFRTVRISLPVLLKWSAAVSAVVLIIVPLLAEKSVPGDGLYAIKVRFNEEVRSTLTLSPYKKVEWETERLNRRIAEARLLASEGRLTNEVEVEMAAAVKEHTENVQHEIEILRQSDADNATLASIELNTTLVLQSSSLQESGITLAMAAVADEGSDNSTQLLADVINESLYKQSKNASSTIPSYDKIMARVEINTTRAYELLNSLNLPAENPLHGEIDRRLQDVNRSIVDANNLRTIDESRASQLLVEALQRTQKLIIFVTDIEVGKSMDLESIVPIIPTDEEEIQHTNQFNEEINWKIEALRKSLPQMSAAVAGKVQFAIDTVAKEQIVIKESKDFANTKLHAEQAIVLLNDAVALATADGVIVTSETPEAEVAEPVATTTDVVNTKPVAQ